MAFTSDLAVETAGLTRRYGDVLAVDDLNLHVPKTGVYGFLGPNGAGKTTTIRMLLGLTRPDRGRIRIFGQPMNPATRRDLLRRIGAMVEAPSLYPHLTGYENLRVTQKLAGLDRSHIAHVLHIVRLEQDATRLVQEYSQGMRQRLGIALALIGEPRLLILDEPTNGLDPAGIHEIRSLIRGFPSDHGISVFLSSHLLAEVEQTATHVGIIGGGRLLFQGRLEELQSRHRQRLIIEVDQPQRASSILHQCGSNSQAVDESSLTMEFSDRTEVAEAASVLIRAGLNVYQLRTVKPSLEDLFLDLTRDFQLGFSAAEKTLR